MKQEGIPFLTGRREASGKNPQPAVEAPKNSDFQSRLAAARESSAGRATQSIAAIRRQQALPSGGDNHEIEELYRKLRAAEAAGRPQLARVYLRLIERSRVGDRPRWCANGGAYLGDAATGIGQ
jgi:hypothetical protein